MEKRSPLALPLALARASRREASRSPLASGEGEEKATTEAQSSQRNEEEREFLGKFYYAHKSTSPAAINATSTTNILSKCI
jgi:hypothetical protein